MEIGSNGESGKVTSPRFAAKSGQTKSGFKQGTASPFPAFRV
jgi:hypothetical protein